MPLIPPKSVIVQNALFQETTGLTETQCIVTWTPVNGVSGYNVYRNLTPYGIFQQMNLSGLIGTTSFLDTNVPFIIDTDPYYCVTSVNLFGESTPSPPLTYENPNAWAVSPFTDVNLTNTVANGTVNGSLTIKSEGILPTCITATSPYFFNEVRSRNLWLLQNDGSDVWLFKRLNKQIDVNSEEDYARNATVTYFPAIKIKVRIVDTKALKELATYGFRRQNVPRCYTIWTPRLHDHDMVLDSEGRLYEILNVTGYYWRQQITHQDFEMRMMERTDDAYTNPNLIAPGPLAPYTP
jgi:hypothetical protein